MNKITPKIFNGSLELVIEEMVVKGQEARKILDELYQMIEETFLWRI